MTAVEDEQIGVPAENPADARDELADGAVPPPDGAQAAAPERHPSHVVLPVVAAALLTIAVLTIVATSVARAPVTTPAVVGMSTHAAEARVLQAGLSTGTVLVTIQSGFPSGRVIQQSPVVATAVPRGTPVNLVESQASVDTTVPDLSLAQSDAASNSLMHLWLTPVQASQISSDVAYGRVISQLPPPGTVIRSNAQVAIVVSEGPGKGGVRVPNLVGKTAAQARAVLEGIYLQPQWLDRSGSPTATPDGTVTGQAFEPGAVTQVGALVPLTLGPAK